MPLRTVVGDAVARLAPKYGEGEARAMVRIIFENLKGWSPVDMVMKADTGVSEFIIGKVNGAIDRLMRDEPIQYVFGNARFYGMTLRVTRDTLIPRPETEELVDMIVKDYAGRRDLRVLDAGTGSGCIAIALARNLPFSRVEGIDVSDGALAVARGNAMMLKADVDFSNRDMLTLPLPEVPGYDVIVSNPPYIALGEQSSMEANVLDYEPAGALFVPDDNPLKFYKALSGYAIGALNPGGGLYFEINPLYARDLVAMLGRLGFDDVATFRDMHGRERFAVARKRTGV